MGLRGRSHSGRWDRPTEYRYGEDSTSTLSRGDRSIHLKDDCYLLKLFGIYFMVIGVRTLDRNPSEGPLIRVETPTPVLRLQSRYGTRLFQT